MPLSKGAVMRRRTRTRSPGAWTPCRGPPPRALRLAADDDAVLDGPVRVPVVGPAGLGPAVEGRAVEEAAPALGGGRGAGSPTPGGVQRRWTRRRRRGARGRAHGSARGRGRRWRGARHRSRWRVPRSSRGRPCRRGPSGRRCRPCASGRTRRRSSTERWRGSRRSSHVRDLALELRAVELGRVGERVDEVPEARPDSTIAARRPRRRPRGRRAACPVATPWAPVRVAMSMTVSALSFRAA